MDVAAEIADRGVQLRAVDVGKQCPGRACVRAVAWQPLAKQLTVAAQQSLKLRIAHGVDARAQLGATAAREQVFE